jgi:hypothetical protein
MNPARRADGSTSLKDDFRATSPKYLICLAASEARFIRLGSVVSSVLMRELPPIAAALLGCSRTTLASTTNVDTLGLVLSMMNSTLMERQN